MASHVVRRSLKVFVGNISWTVSQRELGDYFTRFGGVKDAKIIFDKTGISKGFGFVTFQNKKGYEAVLNHEALNLSGQTLTVRPAMARPAMKQSTASISEDSNTTST